MPKQRKRQQNTINKKYFTNLRSLRHNMVFVGYWFVEIVSTVILVIRTSTRTYRVKLPSTCQPTYHSPSPLLFVTLCFALVVFGPFQSMRTLIARVSERTSSYCMAVRAVQGVVLRSQCVRTRGFESHVMHFLFSFFTFAVFSFLFVLPMYISLYKHSYEPGPFSARAT